MMKKESKNWKERKCETCGKIFLVTDYQVEKRNKRFCSMGCKRLSENHKTKLSEANKKWRESGGQAWNKGMKTGKRDDLRKGQYFNCQTCGKIFYRAQHQIDKGKNKFCSFGCRRHTEAAKKRMSESRKGQRTGADNNNWKGGVTKENDKIRKSKEYKDWAKSVYKKDSYTCWKCGEHCREGNIVAHHLLFFADHPEHRFKIENGITLHRSCHLKIHNKLKKQELIHTQYDATSSLNFS